MKRTPLKRSTKPIKKVNPVAKAKRTARYRKMLAGKEYKTARVEAFERSGNQCELTWTTEAGRDILGYRAVELHRCPITKHLHAHHLRYPKSRPLAATDLQVLCEIHHEFVESLKPHKQRMF